MSSQEFFDFTLIFSPAAICRSACKPS